MSIKLKLGKKPSITITDTELIETIISLSGKQSRTPARFADSCLRLGLCFYQARSQGDLIEAIEHLMPEVIDCEDERGVRPNEAT